MAQADLWNYGLIGSVGTRWTGKHLFMGHNCYIWIMHSNSMYLFIPLEFNILEISWRWIIRTVCPQESSLLLHFLQRINRDWLIFLLLSRSSLADCTTLIFTPKIMSLPPEFLSLEMGSHQLMAFRRSTQWACLTPRGFLPYSHSSLTSVSVMNSFFPERLMALLNSCV